MSTKPRTTPTRIVRRRARRNGRDGNAGPARRTAAGLTLIQLMVIIGAIGIVAAVVVRMLLERTGAPGS